MGMGKVDVRGGASPGTAHQPIYRPQNFLQPGQTGFGNAEKFFSHSDGKQGSKYRVPHFNENGVHGKAHNFQYPRQGAVHRQSPGLVIHHAEGMEYPAQCIFVHGSQHGGN